MSTNGGEPSARKNKGMGGEGVADRWARIGSALGQREMGREIKGSGPGPKEGMDWGKLGLGPKRI